MSDYSKRILVVKEEKLIKQLEEIEALEKYLKDSGFIKKKSIKEISPIASLKK